MTRISRGLAAAAVVVTAVLAVPAVSSAHSAPAQTRSGTTSAARSTAWGSLPEAAGTLSPAQLTNVRAGQHACFDRVVFDLRGSGAGYSVRYVSAVHAQGSGDVVPLRGGAYLQVDLLNPAYDEQGRATYSPSNPRELVPVSGYRTLRQLAWGGSYESETTVGVGVRARLPFRTFVLPTSTGSKVVLDVAHRW